MAFHDKLQECVERFADFDEQTQSYVAKSDWQPVRNRPIQLEGALIELISQELTAGSAEPEDMAKRYKGMSRLLHPDRAGDDLKVIWLDGILSDGQSSGASFKCLSLCYERLNAKSDRHSSFNRISNLDDLKKWLMKQQASSKTRSQTNLYVSLIAMVDQIDNHSTDTKKIQTKLIRSILLSLPLYMTGYCMLIFSEELLAMYGVCFAALKLGQYLERSNSHRHQMFGRQMQEVSYAAGSYTTSVLARLIEMSFWLTNQSYFALSTITDTLLKPMIATEYSFENSSSYRSTNQSLVLSGSHLSKGYFFQTPEIKMVAVHLESYLELNRKQWGKRFRLGGLKSGQFKKTLSQLEILDSQSALGLKDKFTQTKGILERLKSNPKVYIEGVNASHAIDNALLTLAWFEDNDVLGKAVENETAWPQMTAIPI